MQNHVGKLFRLNFLLTTLVIMIAYCLPFKAHHLFATLPGLSLLLAHLPHLLSLIHHQLHLVSNLHFFNLANFTFLDCAWIELKVVFYCKATILPTPYQYYIADNGRVIQFSYQTQQIQSALIPFI